MAAAGHDHFGARPLLSRHADAGWKRRRNAMTISCRSIGDVRTGFNADAVGEQAYAIASDLYPICRSITGNGVRETLTRLQQIVPLTIEQVPTGTPVLDWQVPREWNIADAWIDTTDG